MEYRTLKTATEDSRGFIADLFYKANIEHVAFITTKGTGTRVIRGNHYHKKTTQHIFMTRGELIYFWASVHEPEIVRNMKVREHQMVTTPPCEIHALEFYSDAEFIVFSTGIRGGEDYEADTFREFVILK
jgi:dTDP-4-dehydrorhamnose 3,5-epimerase-like enzyme